ncbi:MAG: peptidase M20 [Candidatus Rokuibacteriota bacterium]|nr:MAG: peptidase M20 [Candidatus Rokubacteria bacterium]
MTLTGAGERSRLADTFVSLCEIVSPSGAEAETARYVRSELEGLGLSVDEDDTAAETGAACGNLFTRIAGADAERTLMLCAHVDTVPVADRIEVELVDGVFRNRHDAILGADNKAAVAVLLEIAREAVAQAPAVGVELVFTTCEEIGLRGAAAFDTGLLTSEFGYVFDHASPIGELIMAAPTYYRVIGDFVGRAAHSGLRPEDGRNAIAAAAKAIDAMKLGRIDDETTANVGLIEGGTATNVVAERCRLEAEVRSLDDAKATAGMREMVDTLTWAASATETDVDVSVEEQFRAYRIPAADPAVIVAEAALRDCGVTPVHKVTGGGSDANAFTVKGFRCMNMANGTEANHTPDERVSEAALDTMLAVTRRLVVRAAEV